LLQLLFFISFSSSNYWIWFSYDCNSSFSNSYRYKIAVIYEAIPTLLLNFSALILEKNFLKATKKFFFLAFISMIGSAIGTQILIYSDSELFKLLLAISILLSF